MKKLVPIQGLSASHWVPGVYTPMEIDWWKEIKQSVLKIKHQKIPTNISIRFKRFNSKSLNMRGYFVYVKQNMMKSGKLIFVKNNKPITNIPFFNPSGYSNGELVDRINKLLMFS